MALAFAAGLGARLRAHQPRPAGGYQAGNQPALDGGLEVVSAPIAGTIDALFYSQSDATRKHAGDLLASTQGDRRVETARQILSTIQDDGRREEIGARLERIR